MISTLLRLAVRLDSLEVLFTSGDWDTITGGSTEGNLAFLYSRMLRFHRNRMKALHQSIQILVKNETEAKRIIQASPVMTSFAIDLKRLTPSIVTERLYLGQEPKSNSYLLILSFGVDHTSYDRYYIPDLVITKSQNRSLAEIIRKQMVSFFYKDRLTHEHFLVLKWLQDDGKVRSFQKISKMTGIEPDSVEQLMEDVELLVDRQSAPKAFDCYQIVVFLEEAGLPYRDLELESSKEVRD